MKTTGPLAKKNPHKPTHYFEYNFKGFYKVRPPLSQRILRLGKELRWGLIWDKLLLLL